jgi:glycosyltransferase 2 family protein
LFRKKLDWRLWIGIGISLAIALLMARELDLHKLAAVMREIDYVYLAPALVLSLSTYYFRALRWRYLLAPMKKASMANLLSATLIGYMGNNVLPARLGELARAYALGKKENISFSSVCATLAMDRLMDGFTVLFILLIAFFTVPLPMEMAGLRKNLQVFGCLIAGAYCAVVVFFILLKKKKERMMSLTALLFKPLPVRLSALLQGLLGKFTEGLSLSARPTDILALVFVSIVIWGVAILPIDLVLRSFGITLPMTASMFIIVLLVFATLIPASPGYIGTYHAACAYGLMTAFSIGREKAMGIALVIHALGFFPVIAAGLVCLWRDNLSLGRLGEGSR